MIDFDVISKLAEDAGFDHYAKLDCTTLKLLEDVRSMCKADACHAYGKNWTCPPACGDLDACRERIAGYREGIIVQTVGELEDQFDFEGMMETEGRHKENFTKLHQALREQYPNLLPLSSGGCRICATCTYPDAPCRFPEKAFSSMEGYGLLVSQVCEDNNIKYYYGPGTLAYTACFLID